MGRKPKFKFQPKRNGLVEDYKDSKASYSKIGIITQEGEKE